MFLTCVLPNHQSDSFIALIMEPVRTSETCVYSNETTRRYISEDSNHLVYVCFEDMSKSVSMAFSNACQRSVYKLITEYFYLKG
jgi:hypothetical protein